ncbi:hypothetical protein Pta02_34300 [Planobispora takensis]|uniref:Uncharacterized protein n=1 Tax=Planobispora takensis TaxID=1367882 RepID=A0A8J3SY80_9ACTN|nr:hypothetical protein Pta02_34300 [Planobispora takensis]
MRSGTAEDGTVLVDGPGGPHGRAGPVPRGRRPFRAVDDPGGRSADPAARPPADMTVRGSGDLVVGGSGDRSRVTEVLEGMSEILRAWQVLAQEYESVGAFPRRRLRMLRQMSQGFSHVFGSEQSE